MSEERREPDVQGANVTRYARLRWWLIERLSRGDAVVINVEFDARDPRSDMVIRPYRSGFAFIANCVVKANFTEYEDDKVVFVVEDDLATQYRRMEGWA